MKRAVFFSYNTDNPQINYISLNARYSELFSGWKNILLAMIFLLGSPPFPHLRCPIGGLTSLTSCPRVLFILNIKGGSTRKICFVIMTSVLKIVIWIASKNICRKTMTTKIWSWKLDKCSGIIKPCLHAYFI